MGVDSPTTHGDPPLNPRFGVPAWTTSLNDITRLMHETLPPELMDEALLILSLECTVFQNFVEAALRGGPPIYRSTPPWKITEQMDK
jgi:hypothetical protein